MDIGHSLLDILPFFLLSSFSPPITDHRLPITDPLPFLAIAIVVVIGLPPSLILPLPFLNGYWSFVIGYSFPLPRRGFRGHQFSSYA